MTTLLPPAPSGVPLLGCQTPRLRSVPPAVSSAGQETIELAASAGLDLDLWQQLSLIDALGETDQGLWAAFEMVEIVARQNGKGGIIEARELAGLFLFGERRIVYTAHLTETALDAFYRLLELIQSTPELDSQVKSVNTANGKEGIVLKSGQRIRFKTRIAAGGRGLQGDCVFLDEAMYVQPTMIGSLVPTMASRPNPQLWWVGSAVDKRIMPHGASFSRVRRRGIAGDPRVCLNEWSAPDDTDRNDPPMEAIAAANPGMGIRITVGFIRDEQGAMAPETWAVERLGIGLWFEEEDVPDVIDPEVWRALTGRMALTGAVALGLSMTPLAPKRPQVLSIAAASRTTDGKTHIEVGYHDTGVGAAAEIARLVAAMQPCALVINGNDPAMSLKPELLKLDIEPEAMSSSQMAQACGAFHLDAIGALLQHTGDPLLKGSLSVAGQRVMTGGGWAWTAIEPGADISPLEAATAAHWGLANFGDRALPPALPPVAVKASETPIVTGDLMSMGF
ncbi:hypothetical protein [Nocardia sp. NPDC046763]|uniref:hypothetical protein n=1 Tax=Nocardia sp. NPDC046763 TaxID=3155256 RepID=UPI0034007AE3